MRITVAVVHVLLACMGWILLANACSRDTQTAHSEDRTQHRAFLRQRLMEELGQKYELPAPAATKTQLVRGKIVYVRLCSSCHGVDGKGNGVTAKQLEIKPPDLTDVEQAGFFSEQARLHIIRKGVTGTPMIGWENVLSEDDILAVFFYVRSLAFPVSNRQTGGGSS